ncbi:SusC/RagA family TonB-linked outer membrane protein [Marinifilum sp.]|uniref:SusC/RagA family TonB-linked outer membrane protein n=1 Tax=Marinifilum sp. TaxID=2033137 RepID=UPI003BADA29F
MKKFKFKLLMLALLLGLSSNTWAQSLEVSGVVVDDQNVTMPGVSVVLKATTTGTVTDIDGKFALTVPGGTGTLVFSFVGYEAKEIILDGKTTSYQVQLASSTIGLEEVVAIGYGSLKKSNVTGSVTSIEPDDFNQGAVSDPRQLIQGKVPGLTMTRNGDPSGGMKISLRGPSSLRAGEGQEPLYVIDGVVGASLDLVAPENVESMEVLRDAASTAIYGARAANGVIMITTKRGEEGKAVVNFSSYMSWDKISNTIDMLDADEYRQFNSDNSLLIDDDQNADTDWVDEVSQTGVTQNYNVGISGGNKSTTYAASVTYQDKEGVIKNSSQEKFIVRANLQQKALNDKLSLNFDLSSSVKEQNKIREEVFENMLRYQPTVGVFNEDGTYFENFDKTDGGSYYNPVSLLDNNVNKVKTKTIFASVSAKYNIIKNLDYKLSMSYQNTQVNDNKYFGRNTGLSDYRTFNGVAERKAYEDEQKLLEMILTYDYNINDHDFKFLAGYSWQENNKDDGFGRVATNFSNDNISYYNPNLGSNTESIIAPNVSLSTLRMISYFGRINYSYKSKYLLQASIRRDGSSAFGANDGWGNHPAFSLGWRVTEEGFMDKQTLFDNLKLRLGYGVSGNSLGFNPLSNIIRYGVNTDAQTFYSNGEYITATTIVQNYNQLLDWERTSMLNIGVDFSVLGGKINGSVEWYNKKTSDLILEAQVDRSAGIWPGTNGMVWTNVGEMENKGFEVSLNATPIRNADFEWNTSLNASFNRNEITKMSNFQFSTDSIRVTDVGGRGQSGDRQQIIQVGQDYGTFFTRKYAGKDANGITQFYTSDGGVTVNRSDAGLFYTGSPHPKVTWGWQNNLKYKNWSLSFFFRGVAGNKILNATLAQLNMVGVAGNFNIPKYGLGDSVDDYNSDVVSDRYVEKGNFIRLDNLTLAYNFKLNSEIFKSLRVYSTVNNVFTITDYEGVDPEIDIIGNEPGVDNENFYPFTRTFLFGVSATF